MARDSKPKSSALNSPFRFGGRSDRPLSPHTSSPFFGLPAFDLETTGLDFSKDEIIQAGFVDKQVHEINVLQPNLREKLSPGSKDYSSITKKIIRRMQATGVNLQAASDPTNLTAEQLSIFKKRGVFSGLTGYSRITTDKDKAIRLIKQRLTQITVRENNPLVIHNVQFERKFMEAQGFKLPISEEYWGLLKEAQEEIRKLEGSYYKSIEGLSPEAAAARRLEHLELKFKTQIRHQLSKYDYFTRAVTNKQSAVIDTQEMAKTAIGLMQQRGNIPGVGPIARTRDLFTGTSVEFLAKGFYGAKELHLGAADAWLQQQLAPDLSTLINKLRSNQSSGFTESETRFMKLYQKEQYPLKINALKKQIESTIEKLHRSGAAELEGGTRTVKSIADYQEYLRSRGAIYFKNSTYENIEGFSPTKAVEEAYNSIGSKYKNIVQGLMEGNKMPSVTKSISGKAIPYVVGGLVGGAILYNLFSGRDDSYNTIEGLGHKGMAPGLRKANTPFGSGFDATSFAKIQQFSALMKDPKEKARIEADLKEKQAEAQAELGQLTQADLFAIQDFNTLEGINYRRQQLREIKLADYQMTMDDADTILLKRRGWFSGNPISIRLAGIDAPETTHEDDPIADYRINQEQPGGRLATDRLQEILSSGTNRLFVDPSQQTYGRYLGVLFADQRNVNLQLTEEGHVSSLEFGKTSTDLVNRRAFETAGRMAETSERGIWSDPFFKDWRSFSQAAGRDTTFNTFTDIVKLAQNENLAKAAGYLWDEEDSEDETSYLGKMYGKSLNLWSGRGKQYNSIEGLKHGWFGSQRKESTSFGSGFQDIGKKPEDQYVDPTSGNVPGFALGGAALFGAKHIWNKPINILGRTVPVDSLSYMGLPQGLSLHRTNATFGDVAYNSIRRFEYAFGGLPKTLSLSAMLSPGILKDSTYGMSLLEKGSSDYLHYLNKITNKNLVHDGFQSIVFQEGKLFGMKGSEQELLLENAALIQRIHDPKVAQAPSQFAESMVRIQNVPGHLRQGKLNSINSERFPVLFAGSKTKAGLYGQMAHGVVHETLSKYLRLMDDPFRVLGDLLSGSETTQGIGQSIFSKLPKLGVGGEAKLMGTVPQLLGRHASTFLPKVIALPFLYGMADWAIKGISPEGSVAGKAGLTGILAEGAKTAHLTATRLSDWSGLTSIRQSAEEEYKDSTGALPWFGLISSGAMTGYATGGIQNLFEEVMSKNKYDTLINNIGEVAEHSMPGVLSRIPGMTGKYARAGRYARFGAVASGLLGLPLLLAGLGTEKSYDELSAEYDGRKEVPIYKARWWEFGMTPWKGDSISYYRPNWYQRLLSGYKDKSLWGDGNISPLEKAYTDLTDPYYLEKKNYASRPYPITGPSGDGLGIFGPFYEWSIGRAIKPPVLMHQEAFGGGYPSSDPGMEPSMGLGGLPPQTPLSPYGVENQIRQQYRSTYESMGLRGFMLSAGVESFKGESELYPYSPILQSASDIDSSRRSFWDLNLGGGFGTTEFIRRFIPRRNADSDLVNPITNQMPNWLPGEDYFINFKMGDIYSRIPEGEYRLPGEGYAARYPELEGTNPKDYPLIHQYKILADVAMYSDEFRRARREVGGLNKEGNLSEKERAIFEETEEQVQAKKQKKEFRESGDSFLAQYYGSIADTAKANPLEQLLPFSPAHKFLPPAEAIQYYRESIYGKEFKLWENPFQDFVKPALTTTANLLGWDGIPGDIDHRRDVEDHFDKLQYIKAVKLREIATAQHDRAMYAESLDLQKKTLMGADPYASPMALFGALPAREKPYFLDFVNAPAEEHGEILRLAPENMQDIYLGQWDRVLQEQIENGEAQGTPQELEQMRQEIEERKSRSRMRRQAQANAAFNEDSLPPEDWIGWRTDVDLEDVKLKFLLDQGEDYHSYNLWENRLRTLTRKPYLEDAVRYVKIPERKTRYQKIYDFMSTAGIENGDLSVSTGTTDSVSVELQQDRSSEVDYYLRRGGHIR